MERFRETLDRVEKALKELVKQVQLIREMVEMNRSDLIQDQLMKLADKSERFTLLTRALPCFTGYPRAAADVEQVVKGAFPVEIGFTEEGWFCLRIPMLLPRKKHGSVNYIRGALYPAMREFFRKVPPVRYRECVIIYRHVYSKNRPERNYRDHDNIEINEVTNVVSLYTMRDDGPMMCKHFYCSAVGDPERTEVYVVPQENFIQWQLQEPSIPNYGVFLMGNRPVFTEKAP